MTTERNKYQEQTLFEITWPLFIEISLRMSMGILATLILSGYSDNAVAGVGVANQIMIIFIFVFNVTAIGATILIGQNLGANRLAEARRIARSAFGFNVWVGIILTVALVAGRERILGFYGLSGEVYQYANTFLTVTGLFLFLEAVSSALSALLRSYGYTKESMVVTVVTNVISLFGYLIAIRGWFGLPVTGVFGISVSIVLARLFLMTTLFYFVYQRLRLRFYLKDAFSINKTDVKALLSIGIPSAGENLSYQLSQVVITSFVAMIGDAALAARVYILNISMFCYLFTFAMAQGTQILVARFIGARQYRRALKRGLKTLGISMLVSTAVALLVAITGRTLLSLFTDDPEILAIAVPVLWAIVFIEPGRAMNLVLMSSLKSAGDVRFPVVIGIISMWGVAVSLSYVLGISFAIGLLGVWIAQGIDEWLRGFFALKRWISQPWKKRSLLREKSGESHSY